MNLNTIFEMQRKILFLEARQYIENVIEKKNHINSLSEVEFQVYSQFGEDGIIQWIIRHTDIHNKIFIEFGVEDYFESNTRFLLNNDNWTGFVIDGDAENIRHCVNSSRYWRYDLTAISEFITKDNINGLLQKSGFPEEVGILSVDIDGNDYWVLNSINVIKPQILICEYNGIFGTDERVSIPYKEDFQRTKAHYSNLYWGMSLGAARYYAENKGYIYLGSNSAGNNAFFVKEADFDKEYIPKDRDEYQYSKYRESRNPDGTLSYLRGLKRLEAIKDMTLVDVISMTEKKISEIYGI